MKGRNSSIRLLIMSFIVNIVFLHTIALKLGLFWSSNVSSFCLASDNKKNISEVINEIAEMHIKNIFCESGVFIERLKEIELIILPQIGVE